MAPGRCSASRLPPGDGERTFVVLGTSHYGEPDRFGLTRKPFATPFGVAPTELSLVDELAAGVPRSVTVEDYCHAVEHSIEFQVVFLQYLYGPRVRILPVLCGAFVGGPRARRPPEAIDAVSAFIDKLGDIAAREASKLCFVLGVDFAHVGRRYGDAGAARAYEGPLAEVAERDDARLERVVAGDAAGFWNLVVENGDDDLKWVGTIDSATGAFTPNVDGPNPERVGNRNNIGDVWVVAEYTPTGAEPVHGRAHLLVTVPVYMQWGASEAGK